ncbi:Ppx/GppA phosphatase family protein [Desulfurobacterium sp.]
MDDDLKSVAVIDIGSNTIKLAVYRVDVGKKKFKEVYKESVYARLLNCVDESGYLTEEGFLKARIALESFKEKISFFQPDETIAFATFVIRAIKNRQEFLERMKDLFDIEILSGEAEAYYSTLGALADVKYKTFLTFDIGGGSLELCRIKNRHIERCKSYPLGTLEFKDCLSQETGKYDIKCIREKVKRGVAPDKSLFGESSRLVGIGGSIRAIKKITGKRKVKKKLLKDAVKEIKKLSPAELAFKYKISIERTKTVLTASVVALQIMDIFNCKELVISKYGIREGIIYERVIKGEKRNRPVKSEVTDKQGVKLA